MRTALAMLAMSMLVGTAYAVDITACGTVVPAHDVGVLQTDLDCGVLPVGVTLQRSARLDLNGHTLHGGVRGVLADFARGHAWVDGPGAVADADIGIVTTGGSSSGNQAELRLTDVDLHDNGIGVSADRLKLTRVTSQGNQHGFKANFHVKGTDVVASDNAKFGVWSGAGVVKLKRLTASSNGWFGVIATQGGRVVLADSTVTGNAAGLGDVDVASSRRPSLRNVVCGRSSDAFSVFITGTSWGVCASD